MANAFSGDIGAFIPTNFDYLKDLKEEELKIKLTEIFNNFANVINIKESAYFYEQEFVNSGKYFPDPTLDSTTAQAPIGRSVVRKVINLGTLSTAAASPLQVPHEISIASPKSAVRIYGAATNTAGTSWIPLPYSSTTLNQNIAVYIDGTNINIEVGIDRDTYTKCYVVIEYIVS